MALLLSLCLAILEAHLPCWGQQFGRPHDLDDLVKLTKGRALLCLVRNGMTVAQVKTILGEPEMKDGFGPPGHWTWYYEALGVNVSFGEGALVDHFAYFAH